MTWLGLLIPVALLVTTLARSSDKPDVAMAPTIAEATATATVASTPTLVPFGATCPLNAGQGSTKSNVAFAFDPFCITWRDTYSDELGFRVTSHYLPGNEDFVYNLGANVNEVIIPKADSPDASGRRKDYEVKVIVLRPSGEEVVGGFFLTRG